MGHRYIFIRICRVSYSHRYKYRKNIVSYIGTYTDSPEQLYHIQKQIWSHQKYHILQRLRYRITRNIVSYTGSDTESPEILYLIQAQIQSHHKYCIIYKHRYGLTRNILGIQLHTEPRGKQAWLSKSCKFPRSPVRATNVCLCVYSVCVCVCVIYIQVQSTRQLPWWPFDNPERAHLGLPIFR